MQPTSKTETILQQKFYELLDDIRDQADGLNRPVKEFTTDEKGYVDSARAMQLAKDTLACSHLSKKDKPQWEFYQTYLYCAFIIASLSYTAYEADESLDLDYPDEPPTFRDLTEEVLTSFADAEGMNAWHLIPFHGNMLCHLISGRKGAASTTVTPIERWLQNADDEAGPGAEDVWGEEDPNADVDYDSWDSDGNAYHKEHPPREQAVLELLNRQQGERLRMQFPDYKVFIRQMKKLDGLHQSVTQHPDFQGNIRQMLSAWMLKEGLTLYAAEDSYVDTIVQLRKAFRTAGGEL